MKTVVKLDYATFAFEQGSISIPKIEDAIAQCDLHFAQTSNASENSPYNSPAGLFYKPNNGAKQSPHSLQVSGHGCNTPTFFKFPLDNCFALWYHLAMEMKGGFLT